MFPKVCFSVKGLDFFKPSEEIYKIYKNAEFKKGDTFSIKSMQSLIKFYIDCLQKYDGWKGYNFKHIKSSNQYTNNIGDFFRDVAEDGYKITYQDVSDSYIKEKNNNGELYLFQIKNQDWNLDKAINGIKKTTTKNLHTLYFEALFSKENAEQNFPIKLNGQAEIFYRPKTSQGKLGTKLVNNKEVVNHKRYSEDKIFFHVPLTLNRTKNRTKNEAQKFNSKVNEFLVNNPNINIIGIDRGEKHLAYYSVINQQGEILSDAKGIPAIGSLNFVGQGADGKEIDKVVYGNWNDGSVSNNAIAVSDPMSLARKTDGYNTDSDYKDFVATTQITEGKPNVIVTSAVGSNTVSTTASTTAQTASEKEENTLPMISILLPEEIIVGEPVEFDASETIDLEEDELSFAWDFGDGSHAYGETVLHEYKEDGTFTVTLVVKDGIGQSKETAKVKVSQLLSNSVISNEVGGVAATRLRSESVGTSARQGGSYLGLVGLDKMSEVGTGDRVKVSGVVAVLPNVFGSQYFYIASGLNGVQIYMNSKKFPELKIGDVVEVSGEISEPYGEKRVKVKNTTDIKILKNQGEPAPAELTTIDLSESLGALVKIKGEVTEMKSTHLFIDDGEGEVKVVFKSGANITKGGLQIGDLVEVSGVVGQSSSGIQLLPRKMVDIVKTGHIEEDLLASSEHADKNKTTETYLTATAGGLTSILISLAAKARGKVAVGLLKRVGGLAMLVVRRKTKV